MEWIEGKKRLIDVLQKYKYAALIVLVGVLLMVLPIGRSTTDKADTQTTDNTTEPQLSDRLSDILGQIKGAGRVVVMLTESTGTQYLYQTNEDVTTDSDRINRRTETILVTTDQRNQTGLISTVIPPKYMGAVVICDGADDPSVKLAVVDAVSKATGLGSDRISVLKMK